jgi:CubicO group peptidase (beta-lactamase class C family)
MGISDMVTRIIAWPTNLRICLYIYRRLHGNPELRQLLVRENGIAPMNRYLFAPDGIFIMSEEEFIKVAPKITEDHYKASYPDRGWVEYSNANHIFAGMILEAVTGQDIGVLMRELVFDWLGMKITFMDERSLDLPHVRATIATGYQVSANRTRRSAVASRYLSDVMEVASWGAHSCTGTIANLYRAYLEGASAFGALRHDSRVLCMDVLMKRDIVYIVCTAP